MQPHEFWNILRFITLFIAIACSIHSIWQHVRGKHHHAKKKLVMEETTSQDFHQFVKQQQEVADSTVLLQEDTQRLCKEES